MVGQSNLGRSQGDMNSRTDRWSGELSPSRLLLHHELRAPLYVRAGHCFASVVVMCMVAFPVVEERSLPRELPRRDQWLCPHGNHI